MTAPSSTTRRSTTGAAGVACFVVGLVVAVCAAVLARTANLELDRVPLGSLEYGSRWIIDEPEGAVILRRVELTLREGRAPVADNGLGFESSSPTPPAPFFEGLLARTFALTHPDSLESPGHEAELESFAILWTTAWVIAAIAALHGLIWSVTRGASLAWRVLVAPLGSILFVLLAVLTPEGGQGLTGFATAIGSLPAAVALSGSGLVLAIHAAEVRERTASSIGAMGAGCFGGLALLCHPAGWAGIVGASWVMLRALSRGSNGSVPGAWIPGTLVHAAAAVTIFLPAERYGVRADFRVLSLSWPALIAVTGALHPLTAALLMRASRRGVRTALETVSVIAAAGLIGIWVVEPSSRWANTIEPIALAGACIAVTGLLVGLAGGSEQPRARGVALVGLSLLVFAMGVPTVAATESLDRRSNSDHRARRIERVRHLRELRETVVSPGRWDRARALQEWCVLAPPRWSPVVAYHARLPVHSSNLRGVSDAASETATSILMAEVTGETQIELQGENVGLVVVDRSAPANASDRSLWRRGLLNEVGRSTLEMQPLPTETVESGLRVWRVSGSGVRLTVGHEADGAQHQ